MAGGWTNSHSTHASHTLIALDLILFHLQWKTVHWKKGRKNREVGRCRGRGVALFSQMKWKARVAAICQSKRRVQRWVRQPGFFFFSPPCSLSNYMAQEKAYKEGKGWCSTAEVRKMDILTERGRLQTASCFSMLSTRLICSFFAKNLPIRHWGQKQHGILKSKSDCGQSSVEGVSVCWERERNEAKRKKETSGSRKVSRAGIPH